jgi:Leucine-rich repeat (LRR) protein
MGHVVSIRLAGAGLFGQFPDSWCSSALGQTLRELDVSGNRITALPPDMAACARLERLDISSNRLVGTVESGLAFARAMPLLQSLRLSQSGLDGTLPDHLQLRAATTDLQIAA